MTDPISHDSPITAGLVLTVLIAVGSVVAWFYRVLSGYVPRREHELQTQALTKQIDDLKTVVKDGFADMRKEIRHGRDDEG